MRVLRAMTGLLPCLVVGCQSGATADNQSLRSNASPTTAIAEIAGVAQTCWFKSQDPAFKGLRMSNEVNSYAGRPRVLLVKRTDPNGLPLLVIQAERSGNSTSGTFTNIQTFGPMLQTKNGKRIVDDVKRWSTGNKACKVS